MKKNMRSLVVSTLLVIALLVGKTGMGLAEEPSPPDTMNFPVISQQKSSPAQTEEKDTSAPEVLKLKDVVVEAQRPVKDGSAEDGYRVDSVSVGPLGDRDLLDTPYSINVVPGDLMKNQQITSLKEVSKYLPSMQIEERGGPNVGRPQTRGFEGTVSENNRMDGMNIAVTTAYPMEQFEQIEVLNGLAGSLYGPGNPAGVFNFVLKRPTEEPFQQVNMSYGTQKQTGYHGDLGGPIGDKLGYRINLLYGDGEGYVDQSNLRRKLASIAFDWHVFSDTVVELNFSYYDYNKKGYPTSFAFASDIQLPEAFDPTRKGLGQTWAGRHLTTRTASMRVKHDFNHDWHLTAGVLDQVANRDFHSVSNTLIDNDGNYTTTFSASSGAWEVDSDILYLNGRVQTGGVLHDLVLGTNGHERRGMRARNSMSRITLGTSNIYDPASYDEPDWWVDGDRYKGSVQQQQALIMGDTVTFNKSWSAMLSASQNWLKSRRYDKTGETISSTKDDGSSPAVSVMYKPKENMTTYITYTDSLQQGATAPTGATNEGETMEPYRSEQWEGCLKVALSKINLTAAVFRIERPFAYTDPVDNVFKVKGNQVNRGLELMATGEVIDRVMVYAGATFLDPKLKDTGNVATSDTQVVGVPKEQANLLVEYRMPFVTGLTPYVNLHYASKRPANDLNTSWASAYTTVDLGARYVTTLFGLETTWRLTANNLTDEEYWSSIKPGSIDGTGASSSAFLGAPREILASVSFNF